MLGTRSGAGGRAHEAEQPAIRTSRTSQGAWEPLSVCVCVCGGMREGCVYGKGRGSGGASCWNPTWHFCLLFPSWSFVNLIPGSVFFFISSAESESFSSLKSSTFFAVLSVSVVSLAVSCLPQLQCTELNCCPVVVVGLISLVTGGVKQD